MYKTHWNNYVAFRNHYIEDIRTGKNAKQWLPRISNTLRACLSVATLPETREICHQLKIFGQQCLAPYDLSQRAPLPANIDHKGLLIGTYLNELRLGATEEGWLNHQHHNSSNSDIARDQLSLSKDLLDALFDFTQINIFNTRLLSNVDRDWPTKVKAYQTPLHYIFSCLKRLDESLLRAELDFSRLEKTYIDHSIDICRLALETQHFDEAQAFLNTLIEMLQRIPSGYLDARSQCQRWITDFFPDSPLRLETINAQEPIASPSKTEDNRHKRENRQLAKWTQTVTDLPVAPDSSQRLTEIKKLLEAKTSERIAYRQRQQSLSNFIQQKLDAIEQLETANDDTLSPPPAEKINVVISALGPPPSVSQSIERNGLDYWHAYLHHHEALLIEAPKDRAFHTQSCVTMLDTSLGKCVNLKFVPLPEAITMYQDSVALLACFDAWPNLTRALGNISLQRGWQLLQAIDVGETSALSTVLTCIEAMLDRLGEGDSSAHSLLKQHQLHLETLPQHLGSKFRPSQKAETKPSDTLTACKVTSEQEKHKKISLKAIRQEKLDALSRIETQVPLLNGAEPDHLPLLTRLLVDLRIKKETEKNPTVLQKILEIEAMVAEKHAQLAALQPNEAPLSPSNDEDTHSELNESDNTSHESLSSIELDEPSDFTTLPFTPACLASPHYAFVIEQLKQIVQPLGKNLYLYGSALYKNQPNDLDLLLHYQDTAVLRAILAQGAHIVGKFKKSNRHVLQVEWHGVKLDINLSHKTWQQHAKQLDFTIGALYHNLNTGDSTALQAEALEHLRRKELHCAQPGGSLAMLQQDPSILFRAMHLQRHEGYRWSEEFATAVDALAHQATNPFTVMKSDKLSQIMTQLFEHGHARANLEHLIKLKLFETLFGRVATLNETQKDQVYFMARQAAATCDNYPQPTSFMFYAIHWPWLSQNPVADHHAIAGQAVPRIELQKGPNPNWNASTHQYNVQFLTYNANDYHQRAAWQANQSTQPPCQTHKRQHYKNKKKSFSAATGTPTHPGNKIK